MENEQENNKLNIINSEEVSFKDIIFKLKDWIRYFKTKWKIILIAGIIGSFIGLISAWFYKPTYKAILTFAMEDDKSAGGLSGALGLASSFGIDIGGSTGGGAFAASNISALMKSKLIVEKVLLKPLKIKGNQTTLADYYVNFKGLENKWIKIPRLRKIKFIDNSKSNDQITFIKDSLLNQFYLDLTQKENLSIYQLDKKVTIINIEVISENEIFSKLFCESLAAETSKFYVQTKSKKAQINTEVLQKQVDSIRAVLNNNIVGIAGTTDKLYNLNPSLNIKGAIAKKIQVDVTANTEIIKQLTVQLELSKINLRKETPLIQLIDIPKYPLEKIKLGKLKTLILSFIFTSFIATFALGLHRTYKQITSL